MTTTVGIDLMRQEACWRCQSGLSAGRKTADLFSSGGGGTIERQSITTGVRHESYWEIIDVFEGVS
jgi:hypothetical protein